MKRISLIALALAFLPTSMHAQGEAVTKVTTHNRVSDWGTVVESIDVTVSDPELLGRLSASDFDITGNVANTLYDPATGEMVADYADDGISLEHHGNILTIRVKPFDAEGKRNQTWQKEPWQVICSNPALSFSARDVDSRTIAVIDDCIRGSFTYAGLTREYMLYLPKDADGHTISKAPLFVWQIGGGEYDKDIMTVALANRCLASLPDNGYKFATLVFAIANPNYSYSASLDPEKLKLIDRNNALQMAFIDSLIAAGAVDGERLFCAGASSGGGCTMRFMMQFPERFRAAVPCCAMDPIVPIHKVENLDQTALEHDLEAAFQGKVYKWDGNDMVLQDIDTKAFVALPMYFVHAADDNVCKVVSSYAYFDARKALGAKDDRMRIYSEPEMKAYGFGGMLSHFSWVRLLDDYSAGSPMDWVVNCAGLTR